MLKYNYICGGIFKFGSRHFTQICHILLPISINFFLVVIIDARIWCPWDSDRTNAVDIFTSGVFLFLCPRIN